MRPFVALCLLNLVPFSSVSGSATHNKFKQWYSYYGEVLGNEVLGIGGVPYNDCKANVTAYDLTTNHVDATSRCYNVYDCLYAGLLPNEQSNLGSAQVLMGLTPTLLATLAPSLSEVSILSSQRPFLSFLLSLGGPAVFFDRLLGYSDPPESLKPVPSFFAFSKDGLKGKVGKWLSALEYLLAAVAIVNVVQASWQLGFRTVIAWKCNSSYLPFLWSTLPAVIHILSAGAWHSSKTMVGIRKERQLQQRPHTSDSPYLFAIFPTWLPGWLRDEFSLSSNHLKRDYRKQSGRARDGEHDTEDFEENWWTVLMIEVAEAMAFVHILFGTLVFSSLQFVATLDAATVIVRYIASGFVCRFILMFELSGMRAVENGKGTEAEDYSLTLLQRQSR